MNDKNSHAPDFWVRSGWVWSLLFFVALFLPLGAGLISGSIEADERLPIITLCLLAAGWHWGWAIEYPKRLTKVGSHLRAKPLWMSLHLFGLVLCWALLGATG